MINVGYTRDSFVPLSTVARTSFVLVANRNTNVNSYKEFCQYVVDYPDKFSLGFWHEPTKRVIDLWLTQSGLATPIFKLYTGSTTQEKGLVNNEVNFAFDTWVAASNNPNVTVLAVLDQDGYKNINNSNLVCLSNLYPILNIDNWYGVVAPASMDPELSKKLSDAISSGLSKEKYQKRLQDLQFRPWTGTTKDFTEQQSKTIDFYSKL